MFIIASALFIKTANVTEDVPKALFWCFSFMADLIITIGILASNGWVK